MKRSLLTMSVVWVALLAMSHAVALAQPSPAVCRSDGGPDICARFDNYPTGPIEDTHFRLTFDINGIPSVEFIQGDDGLGTLFQWRVWSKDALGVAAAIGSITAFGADDYDVRILDEKDGNGASSVGLINLDPSDSAKFSRITGGSIGGGLNGNLFLQGTAGRCVLDIGGSVTGDIDIGWTDGLNIAGDVGGNIDVNTVHHMTIGGNAYGTVTVDAVFDSGPALLRIEGSTHGAISIGEIGVNGTVQLGDVPVSCQTWSGTSVFEPINIDLIRQDGDLWIIGHLQDDLTINELRGRALVWGHVGDNSEGPGIGDVTVSIADLTHVEGYSASQGRFGSRTTARALVAC